MESRQVGSDPDCDHRDLRMHAVELAGHMRGKTPAAEDRYGTYGW